MERLNKIEEEGEIKIYRKLKNKKNRQMRRRWYRKKNYTIDCVGKIIYVKLIETFRYLF